MKIRNGLWGWIVAVSVAARMHTLEHAEEIESGSRKYRLVRLD